MRQQKSPLMVVTEFLRALLNLRPLAIALVVALVAAGVSPAQQPRCDVTVVHDGPAFELRCVATFSQDDLRFSRLMGYDVVRLEDGACLRPVGHPLLPASMVRVALPPGMSVTGVRVAGTQSTELAGEYAIFPSQPVQPTAVTTNNAEFVGPDAEVYGSGEVYPACPVKFTHQTDLAGQAVAVLEVSPVRYTPATRKLVFLSSIEVALEGVPGYACGDSLPEGISGRGRAAYEQLLRGMVVNPGDVAMQVLPEKQTRTRGVGPGNYDYVIITQSSWVDDFQPLADWKTQKGVPTAIVTTSWIENDGGYEGNMRSKIRAFVQDAHDNWGASYFLLGGDTNVVPYHTVAINGDDIPNDTFYADYDEDWMCEVHVGRAAARTSPAVGTFIRKVLAYEKKPPLTDYATNAALLGFDLRELDSYEGEGCKIAIEDLYLPDDWTCRHEYDSELGAHMADVLAYLDQGNNLVNHIDHSSSDSMGAGYVNHNDMMGHSEMYGLVNGDRQSIFYSIGCWACDYAGYICVGEAFVVNAQGGGVAIVGNSRYGWYQPFHDDYVSLRYDRYFFRSLFNQGHTTLGECFSDHKNDAYQDNMYMQYIFAELTLLGDPELQIWTQDPQLLTVSHAETLDAGQSATFPVQVSSGGGAVDGATVCLWKADDVYAIEQTNAAGVATFDVTPADTGELLVTASKHNYVPCESSVSVVPAGTQRLTVAVEGLGSVLLDPPGGTYPAGTSVQLAAQAADVTYFDHWQGALGGSDNPATLIMDDDFDVVAVFGPDCNGNGVPDDQDVAGGASEDCNGNGVPDECDIAFGTSSDCQANGFPDDCELDAVPFSMAFTLDSNPAWDAEGAWSRGSPSGGGGFGFGEPDPAGGYTGSFVYGYNLNGDYTNSMPAYHLTSTPIDCTGKHGLQLSFWRWLGVEDPAFDHASVSVSNNGTDWVTLWDNPAEITDSAWVFQTFDISAIADNHPAVYLRWTMGPTDVGWCYCGWNIDDIEISGTRSLGGGLDCNANGVPDACDIDSGAAADCNGNGVPDECDVALESSADCNFNGVPDECENENNHGLAAAYFDDPAFGGRLLGRIDPTIDFDWGLGAPWPAIQNDSFSVRWSGYVLLPPMDGMYTFYVFADEGVRLWVDDEILIDEWGTRPGTEYSAAVDLEGDRAYSIGMEYYELTEDAVVSLSWEVPGQTKVVIPESHLVSGWDCNGNSSPDTCDLSYEVSPDCNENNVPDECDIAAGLSNDCDANGIPDECELEGNDCNANGVLDVCDIAGGTSQDCNTNGVPDECDIADGTSADANGNGVPDECELLAGDLDCDGDVDFDDINPFVLALSGEADYLVQYPDCHWLNADCDDDGDVDFDDINPFVALLGG